MSEPYFPGPLVQVLEDENKIVVARDARRAQKNHVYNPNIDPATGKRIGYQEVHYEHQEFPRQLYHPEYGAAKKPNIQDYARTAKTSDEVEQANALYLAAMAKWNKSNRVKTVATKKEEDRLLKIGWMPKPPVRESTPAFDANSDEL